ncbi:MAG: phage recombination protein Bet [Candidatus Saccharimonadales bacterium]
MSETKLSIITDTELIQVLQNSLYPGAQAVSVNLVINYCKAAGLDPMQKPVHIVPMSVKKGGTKDYEWRDVIMPGIGLYRIQAARSGAYAGMSEPEYGDDTSEVLSGTEITYPRWCKITIKRQMANGAIVEFSAKEFWKENYATAGKDSVAPNAMWRKRPYAQLAKCTEAQALRKAFPEIGASPTAEEMEGNPLAYEGDTIDNSTGQIIEKKEITLLPYPDADFQKNLPSWKAAISKGSKPDAIIAKINTKGTLTDAQKEEIRQLGKITHTTLKAQIEAANSLDDLDSAAEMMKEFSGEEHAELSAIYQHKLEELT